MVCYQDAWWSPSYVVEFRCSSSPLFFFCDQISRSCIISDTSNQPGTLEFLWKFWKCAKLAFKDFSSKLYFENFNFNGVCINDTLGFRYCILRDHQLSLAKLSWKWAKKLIILKDFLSRLIIEIRQLNYIPLGLILKRFSRSYLIDLSAKKN